jgi:hypothetical protein
MSHDDPIAEQNTLKAMLGLPGEPVFLDIKPVSRLSNGEKHRLNERLAVVTRELEQPAPEPEPACPPQIEEPEPAPWWQWWRW